ITLGKRRNPRRLNEWPGGQMHDHRRDELLPEDEGRQVTHDAVRSLPGEPGQEPVEDLGKVMLFDETANVTVRVVEQLQDHRCDQPVLRHEDVPQLAIGSPYARLKAVDIAILQVAKVMGDARNGPMAL